LEYVHGPDVCVGLLMQPAAANAAIRSVRALYQKIPRVEARMAPEPRGDRVTRADGACDVC